MANNKTTYTLQIDAEINSLEKKLGSIQNLMQNVMKKTAEGGFPPIFTLFTLLFSLPYTFSVFFRQISPNALPST